MNTINWSELVDQLFSQQLTQWDLAAKNYASLGSIHTRSLQFDGFRMVLQCNPERIVSSAAKLDAQTLQQRPCFLCQANRPAVQRGLDYFTADRHYQILINPYPIFPKHLTIPDVQHVPQQIASRMIDMLHLARHLHRYLLFYNGPQCGASAPDHFHFQAGIKGVLPIETEWPILPGLKLLHDNACKIWSVDHYLRQVIILQSKDLDVLSKMIEQKITDLHHSPDNIEAMINVLAGYDRSQWTVFLFPRSRHRPSQFFETDDRQILFSPASVDMAGLLIIPRKNDFDKLNRELVADMLQQVSMY